MTLRMTEQQLQDVMKRRYAAPYAAALVEQALNSPRCPVVLPATPKRRGANKLETAYAQRLEALRSQGEVLAYFFERLTLKIADDCRYTPDYFVVTPAGLELHEVKGPHAWEDSLIKLKVAADLFPWFRFTLNKRVKGEWISKEIRTA